MYLVRCLNPANHHLARIKKADKDFAKKLDFKVSIKFPVKVRNWKKKLTKLKKKKEFHRISIFGHQNKEKHSNYESKKCCEEKHVNLLLMEKRKETLFSY